MTVLLEFVVSEGVTPELADEVEVEMGVRDDPPVGLVVHTRLVRRGQWHVVDVWDSVEASKRSSETGLMATMSGGAPVDGAAPPGGVRRHEG